MFRFENLEIWGLAIDYAKGCYGVAGNFPQHEKYSLSDQLRRAAISISNNIAEGSVGSPANFRKYIVTAIGSALETVNIIHFAREIGYITKQQQEDGYEEAEKLIRKMRSFSKTLSD